MSVELAILPVGPLQANCYILSDSAGNAVIIDPGGDAKRLLAELPATDTGTRLILLTHGHADHIAAACALREQLGAQVLAHAADWHFIVKPHPFFAMMVGGLKPCQLDGTLEDGQEIALGEIKLRVMHTPGHSEGSVCLRWEGAVFTGDTLFAGSVGRTDLPGGSWETLAASLAKLIAGISPETVVYPGHGPSSTMKDEMAGNPFLQEL
jgi:glyoxylase-like metal-dependent hydrolase (beta-lactamase superfamily II)